MVKNHKGFALLESLLLLLTFLIVGLAGWYFFHQHGTLDFSLGKSTNDLSINISGWKTYHNSCLKLKFRAPPTARITNLAAGNCRPQTSANNLKPDNPDYWAYDTINIDSFPSKEPAAQPGAFAVRFSPLLPLNNPAAMKQTGLPAESDLTNAFYGFVADKSRGTTSYTQIAGRQAVAAVMEDASKSPVGQKTLLIDTGNNTVLRVTYSWPEDDTKLQKTSASIISSIQFD